MTSLLMIIKFLRKLLNAVEFDCEVINYMNILESGMKILHYTELIIDKLLDCQ
jgi:hypothetical protein